MKNFPVKVNGKEYWISRSVAVVVFVLRENKNNVELLIEKRGEGAADEIGKWCTVCGYLDYNETLEEAAKRETKEETGFDIDINKLKFMKINSNVTENNQNVSVHYIYKANSSEIFDIKKAIGGEKNEIEAVKWLKVGTFRNSKKLLIDPYKIMEYNWAFGHNLILLEYLSVEYDIDYEKEK